MADIPALISALTSGDDRRAEAAAAQLGAQDREALPALRGLLNSPDAEVRWWGVRALAEIDDPHLPVTLRAALQDSDMDVRQCAALALRKQPAAEAVPELITALQDPDRLLSRLAGDALIAIGPAAVDALLPIIRDGASPPRLEAARALALIGDPRAIPALFEALDGDSTLTAYWAETGLERMGVGMVFFQP